MDIPNDIGAGKSHGLLIYLHGDGGKDYNWFFPKVREVAAKYDLIPVAIMSPTSNVNGPSWWWDADPNAVFLDHLLKAQFIRRFNIDRSRIIFTGASGGPTFMNGPWLRYYASQYRGGAVLFCGGLVQTGLPYRATYGFRENFKLAYYTGTKDFLLGGTKAAVEYYRTHGLQATEEYPEGIDHCAFAPYMNRLLDERIEKILGKVVIPATNL